MITFLNIKRDNLFLTIIIIGLVLTFIAFGLLYFTVPDPQIFNKKVEGIFIENDFTKQTEIKLLEVLAQSGSLFENSVALYSKIIFTLFFVILTVMMICVALIFSNIELRKQFDLLQDSSFTGVIIVAFIHGSSINLINVGSGKLEGL